jgi:uncharacterized RDD family membrane protein YckC/ribosomal protein L40E
MENAPENLPENQPLKPEIVAQPVDQKRCPICGSLNTPDAKFCFKCGQRLAVADAPAKKTCAGCGSLNDAASQYCLKCGLKLPDITVGGVPVKYGGFWIRLAAIIIDSMILNTFTSIVSIPFYIPVLRKMNDWLSSVSYSQSTDPFAFFNEMVNSDWYLQLLGYSLLVSAISTVIYCVYYTIGIGKWGTTIGKTACGLKVVRTDGSKVSYWRAFARYWARIINNITFGLTYLVIAFSAKKQGIHDMICNTLVVKKN